MTDIGNHQYKLNNLSIAGSFLAEQFSHSGQGTSSVIAWLQIQYIKVQYIKSTIQYITIMEIEEEASGLRIFQEDILLRGNRNTFFEAGGWIY